MNTPDQPAPRPAFPPCGRCMFKSALGRCQNLASENYSRKIDVVIKCQWIGALKPHLAKSSRRGG